MPKISAKLERGHPPAEAPNAGQFRLSTARSERERDCGWWEWWVDRVRRCGRSIDRQDRDRWTGM